MTAASARLRRLLGQPRSWPHLGHHWRTRLLAQLDAAPRRVGGWSALTAATIAGLTAGPVAAVVAAVYTALAVLAVARHRRDTATRRRRTATRQAIATLAADLRAGADATAALAETRTHLADTDDVVCHRIRDRLDAITRIAETAGAPVSRLLDRLAADLRAAARVESTLSTHTAGIHASSRLLAALPVAGLGLGQSLGTDPIALLLHTPLGAGCAATAIALQLAGLAWSRRILTAATGAPS